jgi:hypothetical protein
MMSHLRGLFLLSAVLGAWGASGDRLVAQTYTEDFSDSATTKKENQDPTPNQTPVEKRTEKKPLPNRGLGKGTYASTAQSQRISSEIDEALLDRVDEFQDELKEVTFSDGERDDLLKKLQSAGQDPENIDLLKNALIDMDSVAVRRAGKRMELPTAELESLLARVNITAVFNSFKEKIDDGDSAEAIGRDARKLRRALHEVNLKSARRKDLELILDAVVAGTRIRDSVDVRTPRVSADVPWPVGLVPVIYYPKLPLGQVFILGNDCLLAGGGAGTDINFSEATAAQAMGLPVYDYPAVPNTDESAVQNVGVVLRNPESNGDTIHYTIQDYDATAYKNKDYSKMKADKILPGGDKPYRKSASQWIRFSRGDGLGYTENKLDDGAFYFAPAADGNGWELRLDQTIVTIDNAGNRQDFYYVIDNRQSIVAAKQKAEHVSRYGSICVFDRGDGQVLRKKLKTNTVYRVGVNIDTNLWDLFPSDEAVAPNLFR